MTWWSIAKSAFDVFEDVRGTCSFYMFIIEEAIQTVNMGAYLLYKAGLYSELEELLNWEEANLVNPLKDFANGVGVISYPMNLAYSTFADATKKLIESYRRALQG